MSRVLEESRAAELTYAEVGATAEEELPPAYGHLRRQAVVGHGARDFELAHASLMTWRMHTGAGLRVSATGAGRGSRHSGCPAAGVPPFQLLTPCRVVYVVSEAHRRGSRMARSRVLPRSVKNASSSSSSTTAPEVLDIRASSRPGALYARLGGPLTRLAQRLVIERYVRGLSRDTLQQRHPPAADTRPGH